MQAGNRIGRADDLRILGLEVITQHDEVLRLSGADGAPRQGQIGQGTNASLCVEASEGLPLPRG